MRWRVPVAAAAVAVVVLAAVGYDRYVVDRRVVRSRLASLVVTQPPPGYTKKPSSANQVSSATSPYGAYQSAVKRSPSRTGAYSVSWSNPASSNDSATILLSLLPSPAIARTVQGQAESKFLAANSFQGESYVRHGPVPVPIAGGQGAVYVAGSAKATTPPVAAVTFATGRAQVLVLVGQGGTPEATGAVAAAFAQDEYRLLQKRLPGFDLVSTTVPVLTSVVYWVVVLALVALIVTIPLGIRRARRARAAAVARAARRQHQVRGSKIARRQARRR